MGEKAVCSVIIPAYRCEAYIAECIMSAQDQTVSLLEILVIDDASPDNTAQIVQAIARNDSRIRYIRQEKNMGVAAARNCGVAHAQGEWIAFLDSDDMWLPEKIEKQLALQKKTSADLIYTGALCMDDKGESLNRKFHVSPEVTYHTLLRGNDIVCSSVLVKRKLLMQFPMERSDLHEDYICWLKILKAGYRTVGMAEPLVRYRLTTGSKSRGKMKSATMTWQSYKHLHVPFFRRTFSFVVYCFHGVRRYWI